MLLSTTAAAALALFTAADVAADVAAPEALAVFPTVSPENAVPGIDAIIPTNAHIFAFVSDVGPGSTVDVDATFTRFLSDGTAQALDAERIEGLATAFDVDLGALTPGEAVIVQAECNTCTGQFSYTVGAADDVDAPVFDEGAAQRFEITPITSGDGIFESVTGYVVDGCLPAARDASPLALRVTLDDGTEGLFPLSSTSACGTRVAFSVQGGAARSLCFDAAAVDVAGNETSFGDDDGGALCVTLDPGDVRVGCGQAGGTTAASFAAALALLALVRVRSRR